MLESSTAPESELGFLRMSAAEQDVSNSPDRRLQTATAWLVNTSSLQDLHMVSRCFATSCTAAVWSFVVCATGLDAQKMVNIC